MFTIIQMFSLSLLKPDFKARIMSLEYIRKIEKLARAIVLCSSAYLFVSIGLGFFLA